jgi:hypothetical protein
LHQESFFDWVDKLNYFEVFQLLRTMDGNKVAREETGAFMSGVTYLTEEMRPNFACPLTGGRLNYRGAPLNTDKMETMFSGTGWGCWVQSPDDIFYTASHIKGKFHHSSFLEGAPVKAAGEWKVRDGKLLYITGKTGHYKCDIQALVNALSTLKRNGIELRQTLVIVWQNQSAPAETVSALEFMGSTQMQAAYQSWGLSSLEPRVFLGRRQRQKLIGSHRQQANPNAGPPVVAPEVTEKVGNWLLFRIPEENGANSVSVPPPAANGTPRRPTPPPKPSHLSATPVKEDYN